MGERHNTCQLCRASKNVQFSQDRFSKCELFRVSDLSGYSTGWPSNKYTLFSPKQAVLDEAAETVNDLL